jgi:hypothetical protein
VHACLCRNCFVSRTGLQKYSTDLSRVRVCLTLPAAAASASLQVHVPVYSVNETCRRCFVAAVIT